VTSSSPSSSGSCTSLSPPRATVGSTRCSNSSTRGNAARRRRPRRRARPSADHWSRGGARRGAAVGRPDATRPARDRQRRRRSGYRPSRPSVRGRRLHSGERTHHSARLRRRPCQARPDQHPVVAARESPACQRRHRWGHARRPSHVGCGFHGKSSGRDLWTDLATCCSRQSNQTALFSGADPRR
jgi:hypothetical protein